VLLGRCLQVDATVAELQSRLEDQEKELERLKGQLTARDLASLATVPTAGGTWRCGLPSQAYGSSGAPSTTMVRHMVQTQQQAVRPPPPPSSYQSSSFAS
jgi:hypothetical protein